MSLEIILGIVSALLVGATALFGGKLDGVKRKFIQAKTLFKEVYDVIGKINEVLNKITSILEDKKVTPQELTEFKAVLQGLKDELLDVKVAFLKLIGKTV